MDFEWDEAKRRKNLDKHGIDFVDVPPVFDEGEIYTYSSPRGAEHRWVTVGPLGGHVMAIVWTERSETIRIISARRARDEEEGYDRQLFG